MRSKLNEALKIMKTDVHANIEKLLIQNGDHGASTKMSDSTYHSKAQDTFKNSDALNLGFDQMSMQLKHVTEQTNHLRNVTERTEMQLRQNVQNTAEQLQEIA